MAENFAFNIDQISDPAQRFNILLCIDGSEESKRGLSYALKLSQGNDADITLLYVRPADKGMKQGVQMARQNMVDWGFELPGMQALKEARDQLIDMGYLGGNWSEENVRKRAYGDPVGDSMKIYTHKEGASITLKQMVSPSVAAGILDECELNQYDLTVIAMSGPGSKNVGGKINWSVTRSVVTEHRGTVLLAREIRENHGHLICVSDEKSIEAAKKDAILANRCNCPVSLISVARTEAEKEAANRALAKARFEIESAGIDLVNAYSVVGDPASKIIEYGEGYSVIVMADTVVKGFRRFFQTSTAFDVLQHANNSVMIVR